MKRLRCELCSGIWMVEDADPEKLRVCPYCAVSIYGEVGFSEYDSLSKAIYGAILSKGKDILQHPGQLTGFMMDTAPALKREIRIFSNVVNEHYASRIKNAFDQEAEEAEAEIARLRHCFVEEEGLADGWAEVLCDGLTGAIRYTKGIGTTGLHHVEVSEVSLTEKEASVSDAVFLPSRSRRRVTFTGKTADTPSCAEVGDTVLFGSYRQEYGEGSRREAIEWLVLDKQCGKLLLLSKYALEAKPYHNESKAVTWETCTLRSWLNRRFYHTAFQPAEQERILTARVRNEDNGKHGTDGGNDTEDKIFLLSTGEVRDYFGTEPEAEDPVRRVKVTAYARAQGGYCQSDGEYAGNGWWWLRSPGSDSYNAADVDYNGRVDRAGDLVNYYGLVVRPAFWLDPEAAGTGPRSARASAAAAAPCPADGRTSSSGRSVATPCPTDGRTISSGRAAATPATGGTALAEQAPVVSSRAKAGDTVLFGSYRQDNAPGAEKKPVEWLVLEKRGGRLLLLSKYALDCKKYNERRGNVTWETCTLRSWLNGEFYSTAFDGTEQGRILMTTVKNEDNPVHGTKGGRTTKDKVFLLSIGEVLRYFNPDPEAESPARCVKATEYARAQGGFAYREAKYEWVNTKEYDGNSWWWLRSPGSTGYCAALVYINGRVVSSGRGVNYDDNVVRPALWLDPELEKEL